MKKSLDTKRNELQKVSQKDLILIMRIHIFQQRDTIWYFVLI